MDKFYEIYNEAFANLFKNLEYTGNVSIPKIKRLILLDMIVWILDEFQGYVTEEDYSKLTWLLHCLGQDCLIPYEKWIEPIEESVTYNLFDMGRITEDLSGNILRIDDTGIFRIREDNTFREKTDHTKDFEHGYNEVVG